MIFTSVYLFQPFINQFIKIFYFQNVFLKCCLNKNDSKIVFMIYFHRNYENLNQILNLQVFSFIIIKPI